jgi:signal transduction histidine kinase
MPARKSLLELVHRRPVPLAGLFAVLLAVLEVFLDWNTWVELNVSILYALPLVPAAAARSRRLLWGLALSLVGMTFVVYATQVARGAFSLREPFFVNRLLSAITVLLTAVLLHAWTLALDALEAQGRAMKEQNEHFDAANRELLRCQQEITRQNEELDRRRQEAEDASGRKTRLLATMSHDLRSPLHSINLLAEVLRRTADDPSLAAEVPGLAQRLQANALSLANLVSDVLDVSSLDSGRVELHESEFSLNELLAEECRRLLPLARAKGLWLASEPTEPFLRLRADRVKLARVLDNLLSNAIKFTETGGVTVSADLMPERAVRIYVRDTGVGIAAADLGRVFDEFSQLHNPERDRTKGWGLGLAICRRLVEVMGGEIAVESQPNRGSVFMVRLPPSCAVSRGDGGPQQAGPGKKGASPT